MNDIDPDWAAHCADTEVNHLTRQEEFILNMDMKDIWQFFGDLSGKYQSELMRAIRDQDEHEVGAVFMQALREFAKDETE